jgi:hypothetical protein
MALAMPSRTTKIQALAPEGIGSFWSQSMKPTLLSDAILFIFIPQGLKALLQGHASARLKPCPFKAIAETILETLKP